MFRRPPWSLLWKVLAMRRGDPLISEIARTFEPGCKFDYMPVFIGDQGIGKSTFVRKLSLDPLFYTDSVVGIGTKQAAELVQGKWFVELPELAAMKGAALEAVKAFITRQARRAGLPEAQIGSSCNGAQHQRLHPAAHPITNRMQDRRRP